MVNITLKGILGKKLGPDWNLSVSSVFEIFEAVEANSSAVSKNFSDLQKFVTHFMVFVDGKAVPYYLMNSKILKQNSKVEIVPLVQGSAAIIPFVIAMVFSVISMIVVKQMSPKSPRDVKTNSTILGQLRNVSSRNIVVPIGYGRLRLGSALISNYINVQSNATEASGPSGSQDGGNVNGNRYQEAYNTYINNP